MKFKYFQTIVVKILKVHKFKILKQGKLNVNLTITILLSGNDHRFKK